MLSTTDSKIYEIVTGDLIDLGENILFPQSGMSQGDDNNTYMILDNDVKP